MSDNKKIYLDEDGVEQYLAEIKELETKLAQIKKDKNSSGKGKTQDGFYDNFDREQASRDQDMLSSIIEQRKNDLKNIVIVNKRDEDGLVDLGDYVYVEVSLSESETQGKLIKLTGSLTPKATDQVHELTINSPLGKAIYKKSVGAEVTYTVKGKNINAVIKARAKTLDEIVEKKKTAKR